MPHEHDINYINRQLVDLFGSDIASNQPIWRVVWSELQFEKRHGTYDDYTTNGLFIRRVTETREVPKYRQWIKNKHVLERLTGIPDDYLMELGGSKTSYEPIWVFEDKFHNPLPPSLQVAKIVIDTIYTATGVGGVGEATKKEVTPGSMRKYVDEFASDPSKVEERIKALESEFWGNETNEIDAVRAGEGVFVPTNYEKGEE